MASWRTTVAGPLLSFWWPCACFKQLVAIVLQWSVNIERVCLQSSRIRRGGVAAAEAPTYTATTCDCVGAHLRHRGGVVGCDGPSSLRAALLLGRGVRHWPKAL